MKVGLAFPAREADRARLREIGPLPAFYADGVERPCHSCRMALNVGPRLAAQADTVIYCPLCLVQLLREESAITLANLGNPDSKLEE